MTMSLVAARSPNLTLPHDLFTSCLSPTDSSTPVRFQGVIAKAAAPMRVEAFDRLDIDGYERLGHCQRELIPEPSPVSVSTWGGPGDDAITTRVEEGFWRVGWRDETLYVVAATWREGSSDVARTWVIGKDREVVFAFALDVSRTTHAQKG